MADERWKRVRWKKVSAKDIFSDEDIGLGEMQSYGIVDPETSEKIGRGAIETIGTMGGEAVGALAGPAGMYAGGAGGYALSSELGDFIYGQDTGSIQRKLAEGAAFSVIPSAITKGVSKLGRGAIRSALKIPPTQVSKKSAEAAIDTIVEEGIRVGEGGVKKGYKIVNEVENRLNDYLKKSKGSVDVEGLKKAILDLEPEFKYYSNPSKAKEILESVAEEAVNHPTVVDGKIPLAEAQKLKKGLYKELKSFYQNTQALEPKAGIASNVESIAKAKWAETLRNQVMSDPSIPRHAAEDLLREGKLLNALRWVERRANVASNMDPITFNDVLLGSLLREGVPYAIAVRIGRMPAIQSQLGIFMARSKALRQPIQAGAIGTKNLLFP